MVELGPEHVQALGFSGDPYCSGPVLCSVASRWSRKGTLGTWGKRCVTHDAHALTQRSYPPALRDIESEPQSPSLVSGPVSDRRGSGKVSLCLEALVIIPESLACEGNKTAMWSFKAAVRKCLMEIHVKAEDAPFLW